jgi:hypothetical protein
VESYRVLIAPFWAAFATVDAVVFLLQKNKGGFKK